MLIEEAFLVKASGPSSGGCSVRRSVDIR
jgi:hypothetical protein